MEEIFDGVYVFLPFLIQLLVLPNVHINGTVFANA